MSEITNLQPTPTTLIISSTPTEEVNTKKRKNVSDINEMLENVSQNVKQAKLFESDIALRIKEKSDLEKKIEIEQHKLQQTIHDNYALVNHLKNLDKSLKLKQEFILKIEEMRKEFYSKMENQNVACCEYCGHKDGILLQKRKKEEEEFEEKISEQLERFFNNDTESSKNVIDYRYEICRILGHTGGNVSCEDSSCHRCGREY